MTLLEAIRKGSKTFNGTPCSRCGGTLRYVSSRNCRPCMERRRKKGNSMEIKVQDQRGRDDERPTGDTEQALCRILAEVGFSQQRIAALFGCNIGRINETINKSHPKCDKDVGWTLQIGEKRIAGR
jgi:hypothetical protein